MIIRIAIDDYMDNDIDNDYVDIEIIMIGRRDDQGGKR